MTIETAQLFAKPTKTPPSSDSDQNKKKSDPIVFPKAELSKRETGELKKILKEINAKLDKGEDIDLSKYPPLYVVHYRGVHFFSQFINQAERRELRHNIVKNNLRQGVYSPAVYELAGLKLGEAIDTKEKRDKVAKAIQTLTEQFDKLSKTKGTEPDWWGKNKTRDKLIFQHYQRYVNCYEEFRKESRAKKHACYKVVRAKQNPYISTAEGPRHAVFYAIGGKTDIEQGAMRPAYDKTLRAKHPKVGYVQIIFHTLTSLKRRSPLPLSTLHASNAIDINDRLLNERETTHKAAIGPKHIVARKIVRFPSLNIPYDKLFHSRKYGIDSAQSYARYKTSLSKKAKTTRFMPNLADHYANQLEAQAFKIAKDKKGYIVYLGLDGKLRAALPTTMDVRNARGLKASKVLYNNYLKNMSHFTTSKDESDSFDELEQLGKAFEAKACVDEKQKEVVDSAQVLQQVAQFQGYHCQDVPPDGNCFYHAILHQLVSVLHQAQFANQTAEDLKAACNNELQAHRNIYEDFATDEQTLDELIEAENEWADHLMIQAMANTLKVRIEITRTDGALNTIIEPNGIPLATLHIGYQVDEHYQSLVPQAQAADNLEPVEILIQGVGKMKISKAKADAKKLKDPGYESDREEAIRIGKSKARKNPPRT